MSLSGKNEFLAGQLALLTAGTAGRRVPCSCHRSRLPPMPFDGSPGGALIRQGGGYNGNAVSKSSCFWFWCPLRAALVQWGAVG